MYVILFRKKIDYYFKSFLNFCFAQKVTNYDRLVKFTNILT